MIGYWDLGILVKGLVFWHATVVSLWGATYQSLIWDVLTSFTVGTIQWSTARRLHRHLISPPFCHLLDKCGVSGYFALHLLRVDCDQFSWVSWRRKSWCWVGTATTVDGHVARGSWATPEPLVPWDPLGLRVLTLERFCFRFLVCWLPGASVGGVVVTWPVGERRLV